MVTTIQARRVTTETYELGEGIIWDDRNSRVLWVDIEAGRVLASPFTPEKLLSPYLVYQSDRSVGFIALTESEGLICGEEDQILHVGPDGRPALIASLRQIRTGQRINDGLIDASGDIVFGTLSRDGGTGTEQLMRIDRFGLHTLRSDVTLSNGLALDADGRLFHADTLAKTVWVRQPDGAEWDVAFTTAGFPDGMCCDSEGQLWIAMWGEGQVRHYTPDGVLMSCVDVPAPNVSSVCFAGVDLNQLVITTARQDLEAESLARWPASGSVFLAEPAARGLLTARWSRPSA